MNPRIASSVALASLLLAPWLVACSAEVDPEAGDEAADSEEAQAGAIARAVPRVLPVPALGQGATAASAQCRARCQDLLDYYKGVCDDAPCTDADKNNCPILRAKFYSHMTCAEARNEYTFYCSTAMRFTPDKGHTTAIGRALDLANTCATMFNAKPKCVSGNGNTKLSYTGGLTPDGQDAKAACGY